jgi:hypothetical protein
VKQEVGLRLEGDVSFVSTDQVRRAAAEAGVSEEETDHLVAEYAESQLMALKTGLLVAALLSAAAFLATRNLPARAGPVSGPEPSPRAHAIA